MNKFKKLLIYINICVLISFFYSNIVFATNYLNPLPESEITALNDWSQWVPESCNSTQTATIGNINLNITGTASYTLSNPSNTNYYLERFAIDVLKDLATTTGTPQTDVLTAQHVLALVAWSWSEGGGITNTDTFNPLNTAETVPGSTTQTTGDQAYPNFQTGVQATVLVMTDSYQTRVANVLINQNSTAVDVLNAVTYYQNYTSGSNNTPNKAWASADQVGTTQDAYLQKLLAVLSSTQNNYINEASTAINNTNPNSDSTRIVPASALQYATVVSSLNISSLPQNNVSSSGNCISSSSSANCNYSSGSSTTMPANIGQQVVCIAQGELVLWKQSPNYPPTGIGPASSPILNSQGTELLLKYIESNNGKSQPWCADFVSWVYNQAGDPLTSSSQNWDYSSVIQIFNMAQNSTSFTYHSSTSGYTPAVGDIAIHEILPPPGKQATSQNFYHSNLVVAVTGSQVTLLGGDQGSNNINNNIVSEYVIPTPYSHNIVGYVSPN